MSKTSLRTIKRTSPRRSYTQQKENFVVINACKGERISCYICYSNLSVRMYVRIYCQYDSTRIRSKLIYTYAIFYFGIVLDHDFGLKSAYYFANFIPLDLFWKCMCKFIANIIGREHALNRFKHSSFSIGGVLNLALLKVCILSRKL